MLKSMFPTNNQFVIKEIIEPFCKDYYGSDYNGNFDVNYEQKFRTYELCLDELKRNKKICSLSDNKQNFCFSSGIKYFKELRNFKNVPIFKNTTNGILTNTKIQTMICTLFLCMFMQL